MRIKMIIFLLLYYLLYHQKYDVKYICHIVKFFNVKEIIKPK